VSRSADFDLDADEIVTAAVEIFRESGLDAVSMRSVAARLGVSPVPLYSRIGNKEALIDAIAERIFANVTPPRVGDEPWDSGWLSPLNHAIYPEHGREQQVTRGPACPPLRSKDSLHVRPDDRPPDSRTVAPGAHDFDAYSVVWWDPRWLSLNVASPSGIRRQDLIVKEAPREIVIERRRAYDDWRTARDSARTAGATPSNRVQTARAWTETVVSPQSSVVSQSVVSPDESQVTVVEIGGRDVDRPGGVAFGLLVHGVLSQTALGATRDVLERIAAAEARVLGLGDDDVRAAVAMVERTLAHDVLVRARAADARGACRRETPVSCTMDDGGIVEGVVDLAFEENGEWTVVDYKTDRELAASGVERYRRQIGLYARAISEATRKPARGILVRL
jgi:AcrR family transcriptional regulator